MATDPRPLSPHLQVYKPQLTSVLSISHRATGIALAVGTLVIVYWLMALAGGPESYLRAQLLLGHWFVELLLFGWTFALYYHLANGIRHLVWDAGFGFEIESVYRSGRLVVAAAAVLTLLTWILI